MLDKELIYYPLFLRSSSLSPSSPSISRLSPSNYHSIPFFFQKKKKKNKDGTLVWHRRSNHQPWLFTHGDETYSDLPDAWLTNMNQTFEFGSQEVLNRTRFLTSQITRMTYKLSSLFLMDAAN